MIQQQPSAGQRPRARRVGNPAEMGQALDTMRVVATLAVVFYHAGLSYLTRPMRLTLWHVYDPLHHGAVDVFVYFVNAFAMPLFFMAAGVSAPSGIESRGLRVFLTHRVKRLLRPMLVGSLTLVPFLYFTWGYGLMRRGVLDLDNILAWRFPSAVSWHLYGLAHLWFLEYLFIVCLIWGVGWVAFGRTSERLRALTTGLLDRVLASPFRVFWLALPTAGLFLIDTDTIIRVDNRLVPELVRLVHYLYFFLAGGWLARMAEPKKTLGPVGPAYLVLSGLVFAAMSPFLLRLAASPLIGSERLAMALLGAAFPWLFVLGCLGTLLRLVEGKGPVMRYLSESSFWIYLMHLPVVALLQVLFEPWRVSGLVKLPLVGLIALAFSLLTYEFSVRYSILGEWINGARKRTTRWGWRGLGPELGAIAGLACLVICVGGVVWYFRVLFFDSNFHVVEAGRVYRSARVSPERLAALIERHGIKSVISFGGLENQAWAKAQADTCDRHGVYLRHMTLRTDHLPSHQALGRLTAYLKEAPRPVLVQGYRGIDQCALAAAIVLLQDAADPDQALRQFRQCYGQFGGPEHSNLGMPLVDYRVWLARSQLPHTPERFQRWVNQEYLVTNPVEVPEELRRRFPQVAATGDETDMVR